MNAGLFGVVGGDMCDWLGPHISLRRVHDIDDTAAFSVSRDTDSSRYSLRDISPNNRCKCDGNDSSHQLPHGADILHNLAILAIDAAIKRTGNRDYLADDYLILDPVLMA